MAAPKRKTGLIHPRLIFTFTPMFCVLDIESSGGKFGQEAMIEIAAFRYDGQEIVDQLVSLVHPHREVQQFVQKMTGITPKMLARAPRFQEIAKRLLEITENAVIVGHNVEFDYRMLRQEYGRLGYTFERDTLDTIPLAQEMIPDLPSYGLDAICDALGIYRKDKHRAESDARATLELFEILREKDQAKKISILGQSIQNNEHFKDKLQDFQRSLKVKRGLFYIHDAEGRLLYLGASDNIKAALNRLFLAETKQAEQLRDQSYSVRGEATGNWLVARIKRQEEGQAAAPKFNAAKALQLSHALVADKRSPEAQWQVIPLDKLGKRKPLVCLESARAGMRALRLLAQRKKSHRGKLQELLESWPQQLVVHGRGRKRGEGTAFLVEGGKLVGYRYFSLNEQWSRGDQLRRNITEIHQHQEHFLELLKLGLVTGDFEPVPQPEAAEESH